MTKQNKLENQTVPAVVPDTNNQVVAAPDKISVQNQSAPPAPPPARISDEDVIALERARNALKLVMKESERALAENKAADLTYKCLILQIYMKYGLTGADALDENGTIHRNLNATQGNG